MVPATLRSIEEFDPAIEVWFSGFWSVAVPAFVTEVHSIFWPVRLVVGGPKIREICATEERKKGLSVLPFFLRNSNRVQKYREWPEIQGIFLLPQNNGLVHQNKGSFFYYTNPSFCEEKHSLYFWSFPILLDRTEIYNISVFFITSAKIVVFICLEF